MCVDMEVCVEEYMWVYMYANVKCFIFDSLVHVYTNFGAFLLRCPLSRAPTETPLLYNSLSPSLISFFFSSGPSARERGFWKPSPCMMMKWWWGWSCAALSRSHSCSGSWNFHLTNFIIDKFIYECDVFTPYLPPFLPLQLLLDPSILPISFKK